MATYLMFGKYSVEGLKGISAKRSDEAKALIKKHGGELKAAYAVLGSTDLVMVVDLPDVARAMATSTALAKLTGIAFTTSPATGSGIPITPASATAGCSMSALSTSNAPIRCPADLIASSLRQTNQK